MAAEAKKILITSRTHEIFIVREPGSGVRGFCHKCATDVWLPTLDEAVASLPVDTRTVMSLIDEGSVHSYEASSGHLLVCQESLIDYLEAEKLKEINHA